MLKLVFTGLVASTSAVLPGTDINDTTFFKQYLDDMAHYYGDSAGYDAKYFDTLKTCLAKYNDTISIPSQNNAWKGMGEYFKSNGTALDYMNRTDHWGGCTPYINDTRCPVGPYQKNVSGEFGADKMVIYEPCNYVSNVAYYRSATRVCDYPDWSISDAQINAQKRGFATLAMGSAMWHGSHTYVGYSFDNNMIAVISYLAHQSAVSSLPSKSSVLHQLSLTPRSIDGVQVAEDLVDMFTEKPVPEWAEILDDADLPHVYFITFAAIIATSFSLIFPWMITQYVIKFLVSVLIPKKEDPTGAAAAFINDHFMPELKVAVANISVSHDDKKSLVYRFFGMLIKIGYAFMWQEFFIPLNFLYNPVLLPIGAKLLPDVNELAARISGVPQTDANVNASENVYPGDSQCRGYSPHSLWHEASANGLLEIVFFADFMNKILTTTKIENPHMFF